MPDDFSISLTSANGKKKIVSSERIWRRQKLYKAGIVQVGVLVPSAGKGVNI